MQNNFFYLIHKFWKFHWDQACMASATASKTLGGQTQNLRNIIDLVSWETNMKKMHCFCLRNYSNNIIDFSKMQILNWKMSWDKNPIHSVWKPKKKIKKLPMVEMLIFCTIMIYLNDLRFKKRNFPKICWDILWFIKGHPLKCKKS